MASQTKPTKPVSRWGFLSQAVASVESRLDTILADEDESLKKPVAQPQIITEDVTSARASSEAPRSDSANRTNDRLQARLAQAMAKKNASRIGSPAPESEPVSRAMTPSQDTIERDETESAVVEKISKETTSVSEQDLNQGEALRIVEGSLAKVAESDSEPVVNKQPEALIDPTLPLPRVSTSSNRPEEISTPVVVAEHTNTASDGNISQDVSGDGQSETKEEMNDYIERIDALHAKLQYLAKEAVQSARQDASRAEAGTVEKKLAEKDEKIALLLGEGQKLSKTEMKHLATIKKMRSQIANNSKDHDAAKARAEKAERAISVSDEKSKKVEIAHRKAEEKLSTLSKASQDLEAVTKERNALNTTLAEMKGQLAKANRRAEDAETRAQSDKTEVERKRNTELQDDLASAKVERKLAEDKLKKEIKSLQVSLEREKEQTNMMEMEMLAEQASLESKLESFRVRAEEASSGDQGDSHAKLLRQIETLQNQYAAASQNWQGIEGGLLARISTLERERDEVVIREAELRKKLRDATVRTKNSERELEIIQLHLSTYQETESDIQIQNQRLDRKVSQLKDELFKALNELEEQKSLVESEVNRRLEEEKAKWTAALPLPKLESPSASARKGSGFDMMYLTSPTHMERPVSRRSSALPGYESYTPPRQYSSTSMKHPTNGAFPLETPSIMTSMDQDEFFANVPPTPASGTHTGSHRGMNEVISASTVGAGPSVQFVERISANVRRLESEKAASKDELARLTAQRDEARLEYVNLLQEVEQNRGMEGRLKTLERDHESLNVKYQATLELLGEKTEQVDELKADIVDVKQMYRQLADTMK